VKSRFGTAPTNGTADPARLAAWLVLVALLILLAYASRASSGKPDPNVLYQWSTAIGGLVQDAVVLTLVLAIAGFSTALVALRRPHHWAPAAASMLAVIVGIFVFEGIYSALVHPGNEQGLTPSHWEPQHAAAYVANGIVICGWVPIVEELTFRGLGYSLLERFGAVPAIVGVGVLFGLSHGLVLDLPILAVFGGILAWLRMKTGSVFPGMVLHGAFNLVALLVAVTVNGYIRL
jgi:membrane protease YdiL (CAAX protease family)